MTFEEADEVTLHIAAKPKGENHISLSFFNMQTQQYLEVQYLAQKVECSNPLEQHYVFKKK